MAVHLPVREPARLPVVPSFEHPPVSHQRQRVLGAGALYKPPEAPDSRSEKLKALHGHHHRRPSPRVPQGCPVCGLFHSGGQARKVVSVQGDAVVLDWRLPGSGSGVRDPLEDVSLVQ